MRVDFLGCGIEDSQSNFEYLAGVQSFGLLFGPG